MQKVNRNSGYRVVLAPETAFFRLSTTAEFFKELLLALSKILGGLHNNGYNMWATIAIAAH